MKSVKLLVDLCIYCLSHPSERFWQALRNWSEADFIDHTTGDCRHDTFYWNGRKGLTEEEK